MKIWLVSEGEYSSFRIMAAFSTKEKAERFAFVGAFNESIEEFDLDSEKIPDVPRWEVRMYVDGEVLRVERVEFPSKHNYKDDERDVTLFYEKNRFQLGSNRGRMEIVLETHVDIEDEAGAVKVANERRTQIVACLPRWPTAVELGEGVVFKWGDWTWVEKMLTRMKREGT